MLYVRKGSGCRCRHTASAARPNSSSDADRYSSTPSSKLSRWPSMARCKIAPTVEDKAYSFWCQVERHRHLSEASQAGDLGCTEVIRQHASQVIVTGREIESQPAAVDSGKRPCLG